MANNNPKRFLHWVYVSVLAATASLFPLTSFIYSAQASGAPACMKTQTSTVGFRRYVTVQNKCNSEQRVKIIWANASDGSCITYRPGASINASRLRPGRFDGLKKC